MLLPFIWMVWASVQTPTYTATLTTPFSDWHWQNYLTAWQAAPFGRYYLNSIIVALATTAGQLVTSILAAFAFTHLRFYGRRILFNALLVTMMVPGELLLIPNFKTLSALHWVDHYAALIIPWTASVFMMFTLHQAFAAQPRTTYYAARLDGASDWQYLWRLLVPMNRTVITAVGILQLISTWNAFMWPLIMTNTDRLRTLPLGLLTFSSDIGTNYPLLMASTVLVIAPLIIIYLFVQKNLILGISQVKWHEKGH